MHLSMNNEENVISTDDRLLKDLNRRDLFNVTATGSILGEITHDNFLVILGGGSEVLGI